MRLRRRLNKTYQPLYRDRHVIAVEATLNDSEYRLWDLLIALYDWDYKHEETYRSVKATDEDLATLLNWSSSKACRTRNKLLQKRFISKVEGTVNTYHLVVLPLKEPAKMQERIPRLQPHLAIQQTQSANVQENRGYEDRSPLVSYKDEYKDVLDGVQVSRYELLTEDDRRWIDEDLPHKEEI